MMAALVLLRQILLPWSHWSMLYERTALKITAIIVEMKKGKDKSNSNDWGIKGV